MGDQFLSRQQRFWNKTFGLLLMSPLSILTQKVLSTNQPIVKIIFILYIFRLNFFGDRSLLSFLHPFFHLPLVVQLHQWIKQKLEYIHFFRILDCVNFILTIVAWINYFD